MDDAPYDVDVELDLSRSDTDVPALVPTLVPVPVGFGGDEGAPLMRRPEVDYERGNV